MWRTQADNEESGISVNDGKLHRLEVDGFVGVGIDSKGQVDPELRTVDGGFEGNSLHSQQQYDTTRDQVWSPLQSEPPAHQQSENLAFAFGAIASARATERPLPFRWSSGKVKVSDEKQSRMKSAFSSGAWLNNHYNLGIASKNSDRTNICKWLVP